MPQTYTLQELNAALAPFEKMYDAVRVIDPARRQVIAFRGEMLQKSDETCCLYLKNAEICSGCLSMCAYRNRTSMSKLERSGRTILLVTAVPVSVPEGTVIFELLKNVTGTMLIGDGVYSEPGKPILQTIDEWNDKVSRDVLTQLYNRRFAENRLPADMLNAVVRGSPLSIIFIDVNNFKSINDTFGHETGDLALKVAADSIRRATAGMKGWAARYGGDEFLVCLAHADEKTASCVAATIRKSVQKQQLYFKGHEMRFSVSAGVQSLRGRNLTAKELIAYADRNMYEQKRFLKEKRRLAVKPSCVAGTAFFGTAAYGVHLAFSELRRRILPILNNERSSKK